MTIKERSWIIIVEDGLFNNEMYLYFKQNVSCYNVGIEKNDRLLIKKDDNIPSYERTAVKKQYKKLQEEGIL